MNKSRPFRALAIGLAIVVAAGVIPTRWLQRGPHPVNRTPLTGAQATRFLDNQAGRSRHKAALEELQAQGFTVGEDMVFTSERGSNGLLAEDFWTDGGFMSATFLDDGDPSTAEWFIDARTYDGVEVWAAMQWSVTNPYSFRVWGDGASGTVARNSVLDFLCPTVDAVAPYYCLDGWSFARHNLVSAFYRSVGSAGFLATCGWATVAYWQCAGLGFGYIFAGNLLYTNYTTNEECIRYIEAQ